MAYAEVDDEQSISTFDEDAYLQKVIAAITAAIKQPKEQDPLLQDPDIADGDSPAMAAFQRHLASPPVRKKPGWFDNVASGVIAATKGANYAMALDEAPHKRNVEDWNLTGSGLHQAAQMESQRQGQSSTRDLSILDKGLREMSARRRLEFDRNKATEVDDRANKAADALAGHRDRTATAYNKRTEILSGTAKSLEDHRNKLFSEQQKRTKIAQGGLEVRKEQLAMIRNAPSVASERVKLANNDRQLQIALTQQPELGRYFRNSGGHIILDPATLEDASEEDTMKIRNILIPLRLDKLFLPQTPGNSGRSITNAPAIMPSHEPQYGPPVSDDEEVDWE